MHISVGSTTLSVKLRKAAHTVIKDLLAVKKNETMVIVTDEPCLQVGQALMRAAREITDSIYVEIIPRHIHGEEPPLLVANILRQCDVFVAPTSRSLTHTQARIAACKHGARGATMPGITVAMMERALNADYHKIKNLTFKVARLLSKAKTAVVQTDTATLRMDLTGRKGHTDIGIVKHRGDFSNLPAGEAYIAPLEARTRGTITINGSFAFVGLLKKDVSIAIKNGRILKLQGNRQLNAVFKKYGPKERTLCEFAIGTNPKALVTGNVLEDEKTLGTIHVAFGNNLGFGGKNKAKIHLDGVVKKPSVWIDGTPIIKKGQFLL